MTIAAMSPRAPQRLVIADCVLGSAKRVPMFLTTPRARRNTNPPVPKYELTAP